MKRPGLLKMASVALAGVILPLAACQTYPASDPVSYDTLTSLPFAFTCPAAPVAAVSGVDMIISSPSATGLTYQLRNTTDTAFYYGADDILCVHRKGAWGPVRLILDPGKWSVIDIGYTVEPHTITEAVDVGWQFLYGELPHGQYEYQKSVGPWGIGRGTPGYVVAQVFTIP